MTNIEQAKTILEQSGLFSALTVKNLGDFDVIKPFFRAQACKWISSVEEAEKLVKEISEQIAPFIVGQGCSVRFYTDVHACRVIWVSADGKRVKVQEDTATLLNGFKSGLADALVSTPGGFCGHVEGRQRYHYAPNPNGSIHEFSLRLSGEWRAKGDSMQSPGKYLNKNHYHFHDYNF